MITGFKQTIVLISIVVAGSTYLQAQSGFLGSVFNVDFHYSANLSGNSPFVFYVPTGLNNVEYDQSKGTITLTAQENVNYSYSFAVNRVINKDVMVGIRYASSNFQSLAMSAYYSGDYQFDMYKEDPPGKYVTTNTLHIKGNRFYVDYRKFIAGLSPVGTFYGISLGAVSMAYVEQTAELASLQEIDPTLPFSIFDEKEKEVQIYLDSLGNPLKESIDLSGTKFTFLSVEFNFGQTIPVTKLFAIDYGFTFPLLRLFPKGDPITKLEDNRQYVLSEFKQKGIFETIGKSYKFNNAIIFSVGIKVFIP